MEEIQLAIELGNPKSTWSFDKSTNNLKFPPETANEN